MTMIVAQEESPAGNVSEVFSALDATSLSSQLSSRRFMQLLFDMWSHGVANIVLAATQWHTNADLIADVARLGYINKEDYTADVTYGRGIWWKAFRPTNLTIHDIKIDGVDFRNLPEADQTFDVVAFDPPYVAAGGRRTTTIQEFHSRYGMTDAPRTPAGVQALCNAGLAECTRVLKRGGRLLCKTQDYISGGRLWLGTHHTLSHGLELGLRLEDRLEHIGHARPQPPRRRQVHSRRNLSTLFVFVKK